jgi:hypothetical protein
MALMAAHARHLYQRLWGKDGDLRKIGVRVWRGVLILSVSAAVAIGITIKQVQANQNRLGVQQIQLNKQQQELWRAALGTCIRLNIQRANDNRLALNNYQADVASNVADEANYKYNKLFFDLIIESEKKQPAKPQTAEELAAIHTFLVKLKRAANTLHRAAVRLRQEAVRAEWVPLTDCPQAVAHPLAYRAPLPIRFSKRIPPSLALNYELPTTTRP